MVVNTGSPPTGVSCACRTHWNHFADGPTITKARELGLLHWNLLKGMDAPTSQPDLTAPCAVLNPGAKIGALAEVFAF